MSIKIFFKDDGKAKGVWMADENNNIPQIVGLSKWQFFGFLIGAILLGAGTFGIGYTLGFFKNEKTKQVELYNKNVAYGKSKKAIRNFLNSQLQNSLTNVNLTPLNQTINKLHAFQTAYDVYSDQDFFIIMGMFKNEESAKSMVEKLKELGKKANLKNHDLYFVVYLGPYTSEGLAQSEVDSIANTASLNGSIVRSLP